MKLIIFSTNEEVSKIIDNIYTDYSIIGDTIEVYNIGVHNVTENHKLAKASELLDELDVTYNIIHDKNTDENVIKCKHGKKYNITRHVRHNIITYLVSYCGEHVGGAIVNTYEHRLESYAIVSKFRGRGLGEALIRKMIEDDDKESPNKNYIHLAVCDNRNIVSIAILSHVGFIIDGIVTGKDSIYVYLTRDKDAYDKYITTTGSYLTSEMNEHRANVIEKETN